MKTYKVSIVNYLNSAIFVEALQMVQDFPIKIELDIPSDSARKLKQNEVDIALAPVAIIPELGEAHILTNYCIGSNGPVDTVKVFSDVPITEVDSIYLDYHSRTSVKLVNVLCKYKWNVAPKLIPAYPGFQKDIVDKKAGLIIGDRAIRALGKYKFEYDLGEEWTNWKKLPFVYAAWISNKPIEKDWITLFNKHLGTGLMLKGKIIDRYLHLDTLEFSVKEYINYRIDYQFDEKKQTALQVFLDYFDDKTIL